MLRAHAIRGQAHLVHLGENVRDAIDLSKDFLVSLRVVCTTHMICAGQRRNFTQY
jgi:hypothetical protein